MHLLQYVKAMILEIYFNFFYEVNKVTGKYMWKVRQLVSKDCVGVAKPPPKTAVFLMCCVPAYDGTTVQTLSTKCSLSDASGHLTEHSAEISVDNLTLGDKFSESWKKKKKKCNEHAPSLAFHSMGCLLAWKLWSLVTSNDPSNEICARLKKKLMFALCACLRSMIKV